MSRLPFKGDFKITCKYLQKGNLWKSGFHQGIDLVGMTNKKVYSICLGTVLVTGYDKGGFGNYVCVKEENTDLRFYYAHLAFIYVKVGEKVNLDTIIGTMGATGNVTGAHTHIEIREIQNGKIIRRINPAEYMGIPNEVGIYNSNDFPQDNPQPVDKGDFEMKVYKNGSTKEVVYSDTSLIHSIGYLNPYETCECYGIINNLALVVYKIDNTNNKKTGFVKWLGGIK